MNTTLLARPTTSRARQISADEYWRMSKVGFFNDQRVEFIGDEIVEKPPQSNWHAVGIIRVQVALEEAFGEHY